jgi:hypothetical protein
MKEKENRKKMKNRKEAEATLSAQLQKPAHGPT